MKTFTLDANVSRQIATACRIRAEALRSAGALLTDPDDRAHQNEVAATLDEIASGIGAHPIEIVTKER